MLSKEAANINFIVFGLTRQEIKPTIYCTKAKHYTTDVLPLVGIKLIALVVIDNECMVRCKSNY